MYCGALEQLLVDNGCKTVAHMVENKGTCCTLVFGDAHVIEHKTVSSFLETALCSSSKMKLHRCNNTGAALHVNVRALTLLSELRPSNLIIAISLGKSLPLGYHTTAEERNMKQAACTNSLLLCAYLALFA